MLLFYSEERIQRERFAVSQQIVTDELIRNKRKQMIEEIKAEFLGQSDTGTNNTEEDKETEKIVKDVRAVEEDGQPQRKTEEAVIDESVKEGNKHDGSKCLVNVEIEKNVKLTQICNKAHLTNNHKNN